MDNIVKLVKNMLFRKQIARTKTLLENQIYHARCGHDTPLSGLVGKCTGEPRAITLILIDGQPDYCLDCLNNASISCAWCGESILPDEPITLCQPVDENFVPKEGSRTFEEFGETFQIGCLRWNCAETGADRAGFWVFPGKIQRCISPLEECMLENGVVIISDLSDKEEAGL